MFFILSKVFWFAISPFNIILILLLLGWFLIFRKPKSGKKLISIGLVLLFVFGLDFVPYYLMSLLENRIPAGHIPNKVDGIIVLVGAVDMESSRPGLIELDAQADRIVDGIILMRAHPEAKLIITGGTGELNQDERYREADYLSRLALLLGVDKNNLITERNSRNTHEHAVAMEKLLPKNGRWLLITSAFHMPRSLGCFKKEGLHVIPFPVDYKTKLNLFNKFSLISFLPSIGNLNSLNIALHEWFGLLIYRLMGYTDSLFPK